MMQLQGETPVPGVCYRRNKQDNWERLLEEVALLLGNGERRDQI